MSLRETRNLLAELGIRPSKVLGQNFLIDNNILDIIVRTPHFEENQLVIEIGPGLGALTYRLLEHKVRVLAVEKDKRLAAFLRDKTEWTLNFTLIEMDALEVNWEEILKADEQTYSVIANLPYSISTPLLEIFVENPKPPREMVLLLQKEVGERLAARPGTPDYGALSVLTQYRYKVQLVHTVSKHCFFPPPEVNSAIVKLTLIGERLTVELHSLFKELVKTGFSQRRKQFRKLLESYAEEKGQMRNVPHLLSQIESTADVRAEDLSVEQFIKLTLLWFES